MVPGEGGEGGRRGGSQEREEGEERYVFLHSHALQCLAVFLTSVSALLPTLVSLSKIPFCNIQ